MDINTTLSLAKTLLGRDFTPEANMFFRTRAAIGNALDQEGKVFFMNRWKDFPIFLETPNGQKAMAELVAAWKQAETQPTTESAQ